MAWEIKVWNPTKSTLKATYTPTSTGGIVGAFNWEVSSDGDCKRLTFDAKPSANEIDARDVVQLRLSDNGTWRDAFFGYAEIEPSRESNQRMNYVVLGFSQMMKTLPTKTRKFKGISDLSVVITQAGTSNVSPGGYQYDLPLAVTYNSAKIGTSLGALVAWDLRVISLGEALDKLAGLSTSKVTYGVDASGEFFFRVPTGSKSLGYASGRYVPEQINSSEIVTQANLVVSTANPVLIASRNAPSNIRFDTPNTSTVGFTDFLGDPILYSHADASNSTYYAGQSYEIGLVEPCKSRTDWATTVGVGFTNTSNAFDGNPATYATAGNAALTEWGIQATKTSNVLGFDVEYSTNAARLSLKIVASLRLYRTSGMTDFDILNLYADLPPTNGHTNRNKVRFLVNYDGSDTVSKSVALLDALGATVADDYRVYSFEWLEFEPSLLELAKSYIKTPATRAARFTTRGYQPPTAQTTITGHPTLGSVAFNEQSIQSTWSAIRGLESTLILGDRAISETARALRQLVDAAAQKVSTNTQGRK